MPAFGDVFFEDDGSLDYNIPMPVKHTIPNGMCHAAELRYTQTDVEA